MSAKKMAKPGGPRSPGAKLTLKGGKKGKSSDSTRRQRLTPRQRQALEIVRRAVADGNYELLTTVDKETLRTLLRKEAVQLPEIQRPAVKGTVSSESLRKALLAVKKERSKIGAIPER